MNRKIKRHINVVLATVAFAMGVAVILIPILDKEVTARTLITLLGVAVVSLGLLALNKEEEKKQAE